MSSTSHFNNEEVTETLTEPNDEKPSENKEVRCDDLTDNQEANKKFIKNLRLRESIRRW